MEWLSYKFHKRTVSSTHSEAKGSESQIENFAPAKYEHDYSEDIYLTRYPNRWSKYREMIREPFAEFMGVAVLILFGTGVVCQVTLSSSTAVAPSPKGEYLSINFGWAVGTAMGVWVSGGVSGGHINPAITIALATYRGFPWKKVPIYILAQFLGGITGAAIVYANYFHAIDISEGGRGVRTLTTAALFTSYPLDYMTNVSCFFSEFISSVILLIGVLAMNDKNNLAVPAGLPPLFIFFLILGIGVSLGMETGYSINPARDLGPRILTSVVGCGKVVFTFRNQYWLWCLAIPPIMGAQVGAFLYDAFIFTGEESIFNKPNAETRRHRLHARAAQRIPAPAGPNSVEIV